MRLRFLNWEELNQLIISQYSWLNYFIGPIHLYDSEPPTKELIKERNRWVRENLLNITFSELSPEILSTINSLSSEENTTWFIHYRSLNGSFSHCAIPNERNVGNHLHILLNDGITTDGLIAVSAMKTFSWPDASYTEYIIFPFPPNWTPPAELLGTSPK